jgi:hypothetical protein
MIAKVGEAADEGLGGTCKWMSAGGVAQNLAAHAVFLSVEGEGGVSGKEQLCDIAVQDIERAQAVLETETDIAHQQRGVVVRERVLAPSKEVEESYPSQIHNGLLHHISRGGSALLGVVEDLNWARFHPSRGWVFVAATSVEPAQPLVDDAMRGVAWIREAHEGERRCHVVYFVADMRSSDRFTTAAEGAGPEALGKDKEDLGCVSGGGQIGIVAEVEALQVREPAFAPDGLAGKETLASDGFVGRCLCKHFVSLEIMSGRR